MAFRDMLRAATGQRTDRTSAGNGNALPASAEFGDIGAPPSEAPEAELATGVYAVVKNTNYWFNRELWEIEQEALRTGREWAENGVPHPSMTRTEPLPVEQALMSKCREAFRQWIERVKTKMQDAIEIAGQDVAHRMIALRFAIRNIADVEVDLRSIQREAAALREALRGREIPFGYKRLIPRWIVYSTIPALILVEFVANFPNFRLLLPLNAQLAVVSERIARESVDRGIFTGLSHFVNDLALRPEATAVALVVVIALVILADMFGMSLRPMRALNAQDHPGAAIGINRHRRQHAARLLITSIGVILVLSALYVGRDQLTANASSRVEDTRRDATELQLRADSLAGAGSAQAPQAQLQAAAKQRELRLREDEAAYAQTIQRSNMAILLLNASLVLVAIGLGYSHVEENLRDELTEDPGYVDARRRIAELSHLAVRYRQEAREAISSARAGISNVEHLQSSHPFDDWPAKRDRLQAAVQIFRAENARMRKLDPGDISAFHLPAIIEFPSIPSEPFKAPVGFVQFTGELSDLVVEFDRASTRIAAEVEAGEVPVDA